MTTGSADAHTGPGIFHRHRRWVPVAFLFGILVAQFSWAWATPPFRGIDEIDHAFRASSVAHGEFAPSQVSQDGRRVLLDVSPGLATDARAQCEALSAKEPVDCVPEGSLANGDVLITSSAAGYNPAYYALVGPLANHWDGVAALYVMRGVASFIDALVLLLASWCLMTRSRTPWPLAGLMIALTPMAIYTSMLPAPNGLELSAATLLWCALLALQGTNENHHWKLLSAIVAAVAILSSVRMSGPFLIVLITGFVALVAPRRTWEILRARWRAVAGIATVACVGTLYQIWWAFDHPPLGGTNARAPFDGPVILGQVGLWVFQWMGAFPYRNQPASWLTYVATGALMAILWAVGLSHGDNKRWAAVGVVTASLLIPLLYTVITFTRLGTFWQGRYALPLLVGAPILLGLALDVEDRRLGALRPLVPLLGMVSTSAALIHVVHLELARPASSGDSHWDPPTLLALLGLPILSAVAFDRGLTWAGSVGGESHLSSRIRAWRERATSPG